MRERLEHLPGIAVLFTTPLGMRIDEGLGGTPADISVRVFGPDLDELARLAEAGRTHHGAASTGLTDLRAEALTGLPQLQIAVEPPGGGARRPGARRRDPRRQHRPGRRGGRAGVERAAPVRPGGAPAGRPARQPRRDQDAADRRARRHARSRSASWPRSRRRSGPASIRREAGTRRIAVEASVTGRDLGGAAAEVRRAPGGAS